MAYLLIQSGDGREVGRLAIDGPVLIGRSPDCDVRLHDILASREHCAIEHDGESWILSDHNSRNGTSLNGQRVKKHKLNHNDTVTVGRTRIIFRDEVLLDGDAPTRQFSPSDRPANPFEALSSTVVDYSVQPSFTPPVDRPIIRPMPRPMPVASRSAAAESDRDPALPTRLFEGESSPTWATKRPSAPPSARLMAVEEDLAAAPAVELGPPPEPQVPRTPWTRRAGALIAEVIVAAALTGAAVVGFVAALTN